MFIAKELQNVSVEEALLQAWVSFMLRCISCMSHGAWLIGTTLNLTLHIHGLELQNV